MTVVTSSSDFHCYHRLPWAFTTVSVTVINKIGLDKMQIVNCMFLPSAEKYL